MDRSVSVGRPPCPDEQAAMMTQGVRCDGDEPLTAELLWWRRDLGASDHGGWPRKLLRGLRASKVSLAASLLAEVLALSDVLSADSLDSALVPLTITLGVYSSMFVEVRMRATARLSRRRRIFYQTFAWSTAVILVTIVGGGSPRWAGTPTARSLARHMATVLPSEDAALSGLHWFNTLVQAFGSLCCLLSYYTMVPLVLTLYAISNDLHSAIGSSMQAGSSLQRSAALQRSVLEGSVWADRALADLLPHALVAGIAMPLVSTLKILVSSTAVDVLFSLIVAAPILAVFVPVCEAGDGVAAARGRVLTRSYCGPWPEERPGQRRLRLGVMQAACGRGVLPRGKGIGTLDRKACGKALRSWFSFLQMLVNLR